ncbi:MAG: hypothetical protein AAGE96_15500 [Cyanobacteria bacterium P01_G01_bin.19]
MAKEERLNRQQQRLVNRSPQRLKHKEQQTYTTRAESIDTVRQSPKKWSIAGVALAGVLLASAVGIGSHFKSEDKTVPQVAPSTAVNPQQEQSANMLLAQAKLLASQGESQKLSQAIAITQKLPAGVAVSSEAQSLSTTWSQQIIERASSEAGTGKITEAIAIANLVPAGSAQYQQAQQQIQQWQQQQAQSQQQEFAASLAEASRPIPLPPAISIPPAPQTATQTQPEVAATTPAAPTTQPQTAVATPKKQNPAQATANDPYLNLQLPQANVPQVQAKATTTPTVALGSSSNRPDSYGFNNLVATAPTIAIQLRDNVAEDGDFVSLRVNGEVYTSNQMIRNHGKIFMVDLKPGENKVEIEGIKDGNGGITLEVNVAGVGNVNNRPIPEGSTASFIINRE